MIYYNKIGVNFMIFKSSSSFYWPLSINMDFLLGLQVNLKIIEV